jgi:hypothetical protein
MDMNRIIPLTILFLLVISTFCNCGGHGTSEDVNTERLARRESINFKDADIVLESVGKHHFCHRTSIVIGPVLFSGYRSEDDPMQPLYSSCAEAGIDSLQLQIYRDDGTLLEQGSYLCNEDGIEIPVDPGRYIVGGRAERRNGDEILTRGWVGQYCSELNECQNAGDSGSPLCDPTCFTVDKCGSTQKALELYCNELESPTDDACGF